MMMEIPHGKLKHNQNYIEKKLKKKCENEV